MSEDTRRCPIHGTYEAYTSEGCPECRLAETELKSEVALAAYKSANPGDHECPHCRYVSLKAAASRCPLCHGEVGRDYWVEEAKRQEARAAAAVVAERAAVVAKQAAVAEERVAFDRATRGIRGRLLARAFVVAALWAGIAKYAVWLPAEHPRFVGAALAVLSRYVGATVGAILVCIGFAFVVPRFSRQGIAAITFLLLLAVELSQLYRAHWIDNIRVTWLGGLVLGHGFRWGHLLSYTIGLTHLTLEEEESEAFGLLFVTLLSCGALVFIWQFLLQMWHAQFG